MPSELGNKGRKSAATTLGALQKLLAEKLKKARSLFSYKDEPYYGDTALVGVPSSHPKTPSQARVRESWGDIQVGERSFREEVSPR